MGHYCVSVAIVVLLPSKALPLEKYYTSESWTVCVRPHAYARVQITEAHQLAAAVAANGHFLPRDSSGQVKEEVVFPIAGLLEVGVSQQFCPYQSLSQEP